MVRARMSKQRRLRKARDFAHVRESGRSRASGHLAVTVARRPVAAGAVPAQLLPPARVGVSVSRRVGTAVTRNRVRRRLREMLRARIGRMAPGWDVVVTARVTASECSYQPLEQELEGLLARAKVLAPGSEATQV